ncbi:MAG: GTPase, partial [Clostridia bacterium]|nr:GTPase [Clostridia bacterium]
MKNKLPTEMPVYLFLGFLESGKTKFIQETLEDERFNSDDRTLLLIMEEGIEEYDESRFTVQNVVVETIDGKESLTEENLTALQLKHKATRVIVEFNGMWEIEDFYAAMPEGWMLAQVMTFFDSQTFLNYNANMRQLVFDKIQATQMVVFNRCDKDTDKLALHKVVRGVTRACDIVYEFKDGKAEYDDIE